MLVSDAAVTLAEAREPRAPQRAISSRENVTPGRRPLVLHITGDYSDGVREPTTEAIKRLIDGTPWCDHVIFSLKRFADPTKGYLVECDAPEGQRLFAYGHFGLPFGVGLFASFAQVARRIRKVLEAEGLRPDIVHSHRLTFDGLAGWMISKHLGIPHFLSVRGEVESKVLRFKPTYRPLVRQILRDAARIYYVSAWFAPHLERLAGPLGDKAQPLPNIINNARPHIRPEPPHPAFVVGAQLDVYRRKGVDRLIAAFARAGTALDGIALDIYGTGSAASVEAVRALIEKHGLENRVRLKGKVPQETFLERLPGYLALVMPARNETFGMVYTEALFAGVPILYGRETGIDGYLEGLDVGIGVDPEDIREISEGLVRLVGENPGFRARIATSAPDLHARFDPAGVLAHYTRDIGQFAVKRGVTQAAGINR